MKTAQEKFDEIVPTIEHWLRVYNGEEEIGSSTCPLCEKYNKGLQPCEGCPIYENTGQRWCRNTPYIEVSNHFDTHESLTRAMGCSTCSDLISKEIDYLVDILFNAIKDQPIILTRQFDEEDDKLYKAYVIDVSREVGKTFTIKNRSEISWKGNILTPSGYVPARCFKIAEPQKKCSITYKQVVIRGEKYVEITGLYGFKTSDELPRAYIMSLESVYLSDYNKSRLNKYNGASFVEVGTKYKAHDYNTILDTLKIAAQKLHEINKKLAIENAGWEGVEKTDYI